MQKLQCFKAYDIRGKQPEDLNPTLAFHLGAALAETLACKTAILGMDSRATSPELVKAFAAGMATYGVKCQTLGLCGTEEVYHAAGSGAADVGIMVTASHNPIEYNGFKVAKRGGEPMDLATEFPEWELKARARQHAAAPTTFAEVPTLSLRNAYVDHLMKLVDPTLIPAQKIVINAGNGAAGPTADAILARVPQLEVIRVHHTPDGTFPNGIPNPLLPENRISTTKAVQEHKASLGVAWDGDFDRCFFYDEHGAFVNSYYIATLLAAAVLQREPGATIIHDPRQYWATVAAIEAAGGKAQICKVGHGFMKPAMRATNSPFAGEVSSHFYFRDFFTCDSGMLPMLLMLELLGRRSQTLGQALQDLQNRHPASDEINFNTPKPAKEFLGEIEAKLVAQATATGRTDGLELFNMQKGWRANIRASSNEPLLRLNLEGTSNEAMQTEQQALIALLQAAGATLADSH